MKCELCNKEVDSLIGGYGKLRCDTCHKGGTMPKLDDITEMGERSNHPNAKRTPGRIKSRTRFAIRGYLWKIKGCLPPYTPEVMEGLSELDLYFLERIKNATRNAEIHFFGKE